MMMIGCSLRRITCRQMAAFARKKDTDKDSGSENYVRETVEIEEKYRQKSAILYDQYLQERERASLTLDNYQIRYTFVIERSPIFVPFHPRKFDYYRTRYAFLKRTGYYSEVPKELQMETGDYLFDEYERINPENHVSHRHSISKNQVHEYSEKSRYWRYTDPEIQDPHSIQAYSSDNVFFLVKNAQGKWAFPSRTISEKDNHKEVFILFNQQLFGASPNPYVFFSDNKPVYSRRVEDESLSRGKGYYELFYKGLSINGIPEFPTKNFKDFAWVPKPLLGKYLDDEYFSEVAPLTVHMC